MTIEIEDRPTLFADGLFFPEYPRWHDGRLYISDMQGQTVHRSEAGGGLAPYCRVEGRPGGIGFLPDGTMLVVAMTEARILRLTADGLALHADLAAAAPGGINDMVVSRSGRAYVGRYCHDVPPPTEPLLLVDAQGGWRDGADGLQVANGMVLTDDGRRLIVAESAGGRLAQFDLTAEGLPIARRSFAELPPGHYPDGICGDAAGGIWVACCTGPGLVRVEEGGRITHRVTIGDGRFAYACALGGPTAARSSSAPPRRSIRPGRMSGGAGAWKR